MRWIVGLVVSGVVMAQSAVIVWQLSSVSFATERQAQADASLIAQQQRIAELSPRLAEQTAERDRAVAALARAEKELAGQREAAAKWEQELSLVRAELLWLKVRAPADGAARGEDASEIRALKPSQPKPPRNQASSVVTAQSAVAAETPTASAGPAGPAILTDGGTARDGGTEGAESSAAPSAKTIRRQAKRTRKDTTAAEPVFSFLP